MENIIWKRIVINDKLYNYEVSTTGMVRNFENKKLRKLETCNNGYKRVTLYDENHKRKRFLVHRLVAIMFVKIPDKYLDVGLGFNELVPDHLDYDKGNNNYHNLEWKTQKENTESAIETGHFSFGSKSHLSNITENVAKEIINLLLEGKSVTEIERLTKASRTTILHIKNKESWKYLTKNLSFPKNNYTKPYKIDESIIHEICRLLENGELTQKEISKRVGVKREYVKDIKNRRRRKDISCNYIF